MINVNRRSADDNIDLRIFNILFPCSFAYCRELNRRTHTQEILQISNAHLHRKTLVHTSDCSRREVHNSEASHLHD